MNLDPLKSIVIYSDGACSGNPGPGGWGTIILNTSGQVQELGGGNPQTTNNQMELQGAIEGLKFVLQWSDPIVFYTDSVYVIRGITEWCWAWMRRGWKNAEGQAVANQEYWQELIHLVGRIKAQNRKIDWRFAKGHSGIAGNERCDEIAVGFSKGKRVDLYRGSLLQYGVAITDFPPDRPLPEMKSPQQKTAALFYLSLVDGVLKRHTTWKECEQRVKGRSGAKFKKITSSEEEAVILKSWGKA